MNKNLTDITLVVDRSGSMASIQADAQGGINQFIKDQQNQPGETLLTLVQFDTMYDFVQKGTPIKQVPPYTLIPRGGTALLDAVGRAIVETGERLAKMPEADRPGLVVFAIVTDGEENSSREYTLERIKQMIEHQKTAYQWQFTFLAANQDAFAVGGSMGFNPGAISNYSGTRSSAAYSALSNNVTRMRTSTVKDAAVTCVYSDDERKDMA